MPIEKWRKILALALDNVTNHTLDNSTQLAIDVESDDASMPRRCFKSRFPLFKHPILKDEFHADNLFPSVKSEQNHTCTKILTGNGT